MGLNIPDRKDDSPESFKAQQAAIAKQIDEAIDREVDAAVKRILDQKGE